MPRHNACDTVTILTTDNIEYTGMVMPSSTPHTLVLKLQSGYNIGITQKNIKKITVAKHFTKSAKACETTQRIPLQKVSQKKQGLPVISILHTGGTIASEVDYETGGTIPKFTPEDMIAMFPELTHVASIRSRLVRNMWSEDMRFSHYNIIAHEIKKEIAHGVDGIIITHGTDTLAYTAAALSFALEHVPIPVILVAAQRSSDRGSSDAFLNLICAAQFIAHSDFGEVGICMHETSADDSCIILPACKTRKMHTSRRDAFKVINGKPFARVTKEGAIDILHHEYKKKDASRKLVVKPFNEKLHIGILKAHPHMSVQEFKLYEKFHGLVIEGLGLCNFPINQIDKETKEHATIYTFMKKLAVKIPVVIAPQPLYGRVNMNVYETGRKIKALGILGDYSDMLPETTFIKLAWALSNYPKKDIPYIMAENLRGELSKRSTLSTFTP